MNGFITAHGIKSVIDKSFAFDDAEAANEHLASGRHFGKIIIIS